MTYTETLRYLHQLELQKDAEQESNSVIASQEEFANICKQTIEVITFPVNFHSQIFLIGYLLISLSMSHSFFVILINTF